MKISNVLSSIAALMAERFAAKHAKPAPGRFTPYLRGPSQKKRRLNERRRA